MPYHDEEPSCDPAHDMYEGCAQCIEGWDEVPTDECPEHGSQEVKDCYPTNGPDPYGVNVLECGHHVACFGPGEPNVIMNPRARKVFP